MEFGIDNNFFISKDKWNYCHHFPILPLLGVIHLLPLLHISKSFVYLHKTKELIVKFEIAYMVNPILHVDKSFKEKVEKYMNDMFYKNTQHIIRNTTKRIIPVF